MVTPVSLTGKLPSDVVKTGTQVVNDFASKNAEPERDDALFMVRDCLKESIFVVLGDDWVFAGLKEGVNLGLKIVDVLVRPF